MENIDPVSLGTIRKIGQAYLMALLTLMYIYIYVILRIGQLFFSHWRSRITKPVYQSLFPTSMSELSNECMDLLH